MRLFGVAMARNEADVIEAFVRHNLSVLDGLVVIEHDSSDATREILAKLQAEGLPVRIVDAPEPEFFQSRHMTRVTREVLAQERADFVFALDADEFLKCRSRPELERALAEVPVGMHAVATWWTYVPDSFDETTFGQSHLRRRRDEANALYKTIVGRGFLDRDAEVLFPGNHLAGDPAAPDSPRHARLSRDVIAIAHCPVRSRRQLESKVIIGYLAHLATGETRRDLAFHWRNLYDELRAGMTLDPERVREIACNYGLRRSLWKRPEDFMLIVDPVSLKFEPRYPVPPATGTLQLLMRFAEKLARRER